MSPALHIVSFDIPYPANYGGVIDVFHKIKSLAALGVDISLHCFQYGDRKPAEELETYCKEVFYYKRKIGFYGISATLPYIVYSRRNKTLLKRLQSTQAPILFEGLHTCYYLHHESLKNHVKIVRCHNIEHDYYEKLAQHSSHPKKMYFKKESDRLKRFEAVLKHAQVLLPISDDDHSYFEQEYSDAIAQKIHAFHTDDEVTSLLGDGSYSLFHGSLNVSENNNSAIFLVQEVFNDLDNPLIIAGKDPSFELQKICSQHDHVTLISNPDWNQLNDLIANAHIHLMHASQKSGLKLKLIKALFAGRHIIANEDMVTDSIIKNHVVLATSNKEWKESVLTLKKESFTPDMLLKRKTVTDNYRNDKNAQQLLHIITSTSSNS